MTMRLTLLAAALLFAGCRSGDDAPQTDAATAPETAIATPTAAPAPEVAAPAPADTAMLTAANEAPQMPDACRRLIDSYQRCIDTRFDGANRTLLNNALAASRREWDAATASATTEETARLLAQSCETSRAQLQSQVAGYGCTL